MKYEISKPEPYYENLLGGLTIIPENPSEKTFLQEMYKALEELRATRTTYVLVPSPLGVKSEGLEELFFHIKVE